VCAFTYRLAPEDPSLLEILLYLKKDWKVSVSYKGPASDAKVSAAARSFTDTREELIIKKLGAQGLHLPESWSLYRFRDQCPFHVRGLPNRSLSELFAGTIRGMVQTAVERFS
jgi:hypothetical protein